MHTCGTTSNRGIVLAGDGAGADIVFGNGQDANISWNGTALVLDGNTVSTTGDLNATGTLRSDLNLLCDDTTCYTISKAS